MTDKEKTIQEIKEILSCLTASGYGLPTIDGKDEAAESIYSLIENKWISVEEDLPESGRILEIAWTNEVGHDRISMGFYAKKRAIECEDEPDWADYDEETERYFVPEGWVETMWEAEMTAPLKNVTHWRIPISPSTTNKQDNG
jgi:hypothetical protein